MNYDPQTFLTRGDKEDIMIFFKWLHDNSRITKLSMSQEYKRIYFETGEGVKSGSRFLSKNSTMFKAGQTLQEDRHLGCRSRSRHELLFLLLNGRLVELAVERAEMESKRAEQ